MARIAEQNAQVEADSPKKAKAGPPKAKDNQGILYRNHKKSRYQRLFLCVMIDSILFSSFHKLKTQRNLMTHPVLIGDDDTKRVDAGIDRVEQ